MPMSARELFARLIKCEAGGESENGMKAVATVVMNRVNVSGGQYLRTVQGDLRKAILEPHEFTCCMPTVYGQINPQTVWASSPEEIHYEIADWALWQAINIGVPETACGIITPTTPHVLLCFRQTVQESYLTG